MDENEQPNSPPPDTGAPPAENPPGGDKPPEVKTEPETPPDPLDQLANSVWTDPEVVRLAGDPDALRKALAPSAAADLTKERRVAIAALLANAQSKRSQLDKEYEAEKTKRSEAEAALKAHAERVERGLNSFKAYTPNNAAVKGFMDNLQKQATGDGRMVDPDSPEGLRREAAKQQLDFTRQLFSLFESVTNNEAEAMKAAAAEREKQARRTTLQEYITQHEDDFLLEGSAPGYDFEGNERPMLELVKQYAPAYGGDAIAAHKALVKLRETMRATKKPDTEVPVGRGGRAARTPPPPADAPMEAFTKWLLENADSI